MNPARPRGIMGALVLAIVTASSAMAGTYYVDASNGDDSNSGLSTEAAWKSVSKVSDTKFRAGDLILFKRGGQWREQLIVSASGSAGNPITYGAYGNGDRPVFNGADVIRNWTASSQSNVWQATVTTKPGAVYFDQAFGNKVGQLADIDRENEWYWQGKRLYVYAVGNPESVFSSPGVEASTRNFCVIATGRSYLIFRDLEVKYAQKHGLVCTADVHDILVDSVHAHHNGYLTGGAFGIHLQGGTHVAVRNSEADYNAWNGIAFNSWAASADLSGWSVENSVSHHNVHNGFDFNTGSAGIDISDITIRACRAYGNQTGIYFENEQNEHISDAKIYYNLVYGNSGGGIVVYLTSESSNPFIDKVQVFNNVAYNNGNSGLIAYMTRGVVKNNIIFENNRRDDREVKIYDGGGASNVFDYNIVYHSSHRDIIGWNGARMTHAQFVGKGHNENGFSQDPLLVSPANLNLSLQSDSPAINSGFYVGLDKDFAGIRVPATAVDIGAFEFQGETAPPAAPRNVRVKVNP